MLNNSNDEVNNTFPPKTQGAMSAKVCWSESPYEIKFVDEIEIDGITYKFLYNNHQIKKYLDVKDPSFDDVRRVVKRNPNIPEEYKEYAFDYIDELERYNPSQDLAILYYNMENLKNIKVSDIASSALTKGYFNKFEKEIAVDTENDVAVVFKHELTHATYSIDAIVDGVHIIKDVMHPIFVDENRIAFLGRSLNEGLIDNYRLELGGKTLKSNNSVSYEIFQDEARLCSNILGASTDELLENNIRYLMDQMYKIGVVDIAEVIMLIDKSLSDVIENGVDFKAIESARISVYETIIGNLMPKMISDGKSAKAIYRYIFELLDGGYIQSEIKRDLSSSLDYIPTQLTLRENIIGCVNFFLEIAHMPTKDQDELNEEYSDFKPQAIVEQVFSEELNFEEIKNTLKDICLYKDIHGDYVLGYALKKIDGSYSILDFQTLEIVDDEIQSWEYAKKLWENNKLEYQIKDDAFYFGINFKNINLERKLIDGYDDQPLNRNLYTYQSATGEQKNCYFITTDEGKKVFFDFDLKLIDPKEIDDPLEDEESYPSGSKELKKNF